MAKKPDDRKKPAHGAIDDDDFPVETKSIGFQPAMPPKRRPRGIIGSPMAFKISLTRPPPRKPITSQFDDDNDE